MTRHSTVPEAVAWLLGEQDGHCGCSGQCGDRHNNGRCDAGETGVLSVAPADRSIPVEWATTVPADELLVWCRPCRDSAEAAARNDRLERLERELDGELDGEPAETSNGTESSRQRLNWWLQGVLEDFYAARDQWDAACEAYSKGYATEATEFAEQHPRPQLRDFLRDHAHTADAKAADVRPAESHAVDQARRAVDQLALRRPADRPLSRDADRDLDRRSQDWHADHVGGRAAVGLGW